TAATKHCTVRMEKLLGEWLRSGPSATILVHSPPPNPAREGRGVERQILAEKQPKSMPAVAVSLSMSMEPVKVVGLPVVSISMLQVENIRLSRPSSGKRETLLGPWPRDSWCWRMVSGAATIG